MVYRSTKAVADSFGVNIVVTDNINGTNDTENSVDNGVVNGYFDYDTNTMYLNNATATRNIGYTLMHELTHNLSQYNTEAFNELVNTFSDMWKQRNPEAYKKWTDAVHDRYSQFGVELTEDQVMEEILCDQMGEILHDEEFLNDLVDEHRSVAELFLDLIKNAIRKLREMFGLGDVFDSRYEEATLSEYNLLKDAEAFLTEAIREKKILDALEGKRVAGRSGVNYSIETLDDGTEYVHLEKKGAITNGKIADSDIIADIVGTVCNLSDGDIVAFVDKLPGGKNMIKEVLVRPMPDKKTHGISKSNKVNYNDLISDNILDILDISKKTTNSPDAGERHKKNGIASFDTRKALVEYNGTGYSQTISVAVIDPSLANDGDRKHELESLAEVGISRVIYAKKAVYENKSFDKKLKNQMKKGSPSVENTTGASPTSIRNDALITSSPDSDVGILQSKTTSVNKKNGIDHSLDLSTDTENAEVKTEFEGMEDRGWDLPEALENQLIADLESSFVEEDSDGDIYVDGEAKKYAEVSLYAKTKTKGGKG